MFPSQVYFERIFIIYINFSGVSKKGQERGSAAFGGHFFLGKSFIATNSGNIIY